MPKTAPKSKVRKAAKPTLLSGGNPQVPKADGDAPVQAYIASMPGWKREIGRRLDALIVRTVDTVCINALNCACARQGQACRACVQALVQAERSRKPRWIN